MNKFQSLIALGGASLLGIACGSSDPKVVAPAPIVEVDAAPQVVSGIVFDVTPGDAEVIVDGEPLGIASEIGDAGTLELAPGLHQIMIRHENYEIYRVEVTIGDTIEPMQISLKEKTPES